MDANRGLRATATVRAIAQIAPPRTEIVGSLLQNGSAWRQHPEVPRGASTPDSACPEWPVES